jgi:hypothetical protein
MLINQVLLVHGRQAAPHTLRGQVLHAECHLLIILIEQCLRLFRADRILLARRRRRDARSVLPVNRRRALGPQFDRLVLDALVVIAHERPQEGPGLVAGFFKVAQLNVAVNGGPFVGKALRPFLHRACLALDAPGDGLPGMPNRPQLGGLRQQRDGVLAHEGTPKK